MSAYPPGFTDWPLEERNAYFAEEAQRYRERQPDARSGGNGEDREADEPLPKLTPIRFTKGEPAPKREWLALGWIPKGEVTLIQGDGGLGKTSLVQQLQTSCANERSWLGLYVEPCKSVGFYTEDKEKDLRIRQAAIDASYGCGNSDAMQLFPRFNQDNEIVVFDRAGNPVPTKFYQQVCEASLDHHAGLVTLDVAVDLFGGDEIKRRHVRAFNRLLNALADRIDGSVVVTGHVSQSGIKSDGGHSASTDWSNGVRSRPYLGELNPEN